MWHPGVYLLVCRAGPSFKSNWRLYRRCRDNPAMKDVANLSYCLLAGMLVYAISTFFSHIAYNAGLPMLAGFSLALQLAAEPLLAPSPLVARSSTL
jgi:hypothetical protein